MQLKREERKMSGKNIFIINGSPRKNQNTGKMCESFALGVCDSGSKAEIINLYDIDFKGCRSCFLCKQRNGKNLGRCAFPDELTNILDKAAYGDGLVLASPIYFGDVTGMMKSFLERLVFPFIRYDENYTSIAPKKLKTAVIYTMNVTQEIFESSYLGENSTGPIGFFENWITHVYEKPQRICSFNTYQFSDYKKYVADIWDENDKLKQRQNVFPLDLKNAYNAGVSMSMN